MEETIEELEIRWKGLVARRDELQSNVTRVTAARDERKRSLKDTIEECRKEGFNPDTLPTDIQRLKQVIMTKMDVISGDLDEGASMIRPMLHEIEKS